MIRVIFSCLFLILSGAVIPQTSFALADVKPSAVVNKSTITLGDLLENLDEGGDIRVMDSPAPGEKISISTRYLVALTRQHNIYWQNSRGIRQITVARKGKLIRYKDLKPLIEAELSDRKLIDRQTTLHFTSRNATLHLPEENTIDDITLENLTFDKKSRKFSALISIPAGNGAHNAATVRGRIQTVSYVPVLNKTIIPGQEITQQDIAWTPIPSLRIGRDIIRRKDQIIGLTPRRRLAESVPIRLSDLMRPRIITRGAKVSILYRSGKMSLTAIGKATEDGGRGDVIRVINSKSHKTIEATVIGPDRVQIMTLHNNIAQLR